MTRRQCDYEAMGDGYYRCRQCGHERRSKYPPHMLHRPCPAGRSDAKWEPRAPVAPRECAERDLRVMAEKLGDAARPWSEIAATLDRCFGGCEWIVDRVGYCMLRGKDCTCRKRWLEHIVFHECNE